MRLGIYLIIARISVAFLVKQNLERLKAEAAAGKPRSRGEQGVAAGVLSGFDRAKWYTLNIEFSGDTIVEYIDNQKVAVAKDMRFSHGMAGLVAFDLGKELSTACYDNLKISPLGETKTNANAVSTSLTPIYAD